MRFKLGILFVIGMYDVKQVLTEDEEKIGPAIQIIEQGQEDSGANRQHETKAEIITTNATSRGAEEEDEDVENISTIF